MLLYSEAWSSGCVESFYLMNCILGHVWCPCCLSTGIVIGGGWKEGVDVKGCLVHEKGKRTILLNRVLCKWRQKRCHWDNTVSNSVHFVVEWCVGSTGQFIDQHICVVTQIHRYNTKQYQTSVNEYKYFQALLLSSSSSSSLCRVFILILLRQTMSLGNTGLQLFCCYYSWCLYR